MALNNLQEIINELLVQNNFTFSVNNQKHINDFFVENDCPFTDYLPWTLDYHREYMSKGNNNVYHFCVNLFSNGKGCGLFHFNIIENNGAFSLLSNSSGILQPYLVKELSRKQTHKILKKCLSFYFALAGTLKVDSLKYQFISDYSEAWHSLLMAYGEPKFNQELYCDLKLTEPQYFGKIREKFKKHIRQGEKLWTVKILEKVSVSEFDKVKKLHFDVVGFKTRSDLTWQLLFKAINNKQAFIVLAYDKCLVGAGIFTLSSTEAVYSVGVYDRRYFDKPISHVVHYKAIQHMKKLGLKSYYLGPRSFEKEWLKPSKKESQIGDFKSGFATDSRFKVTFDIKLLA